MKRSWSTRASHVTPHAALQRSVVLGAVLSLPATAHASDMGLVLPTMFVPVNLVAGLLGLGLGLAARTGRFGPVASTLLWILCWPIGVPAVLLAIVALSYLGGEFTKPAAICLAAFGVHAASCAFARTARHRHDRARAYSDQRTARSHQDGPVQKPKAR
jgi:hypothetical protein